MKHRRSYSQQTRTASRRNGTILVLFILSLLLLTMTVGVLIRASLTQRGLVRSDIRRVQADWLVQSAAARASGQLQNDSTYAGEQWQIAAETLNQPDAAVADIQVATDPESETNRLVTITVNYPPEGTDRVRASRTVSIAVSTNN